MKKSKNVSLSVPDFSTLDLHYSIDVDYDRQDHCKEAGCDTICRCSTMENIRVSKVDMQFLTRRVCAEMGVPEKDEFLTYCVNRILTAAKLWRKDIWHVSKHHSYYGEEIKSVMLDNEIIQKTIEQNLNALCTSHFDNRDRIFVTLKSEYGYVLDHIQSLPSWEIRKIDRDDIIVGNEHYYRKIDTETVSFYEDWELPVCLVFASGDTAGFTKYRMIDGYHRLTACKGDVVKVIVGERP